MRMRQHIQGMRARRRFRYRARMIHEDKRPNHPPEPERKNTLYGQARTDIRFACFYNKIRHRRRFVIKLKAAFHARDCCIQDRNNYFIAQDDAGEVYLFPCLICIFNVDSCTEASEYLEKY